MYTLQFTKFVSSWTGVSSLFLLAMSLLWASYGPRMSADGPPRAQHARGCLLGGLARTAAGDAQGRGPDTAIAR